jgi:hypothetical protein
MKGKEGGKEGRKAMSLCWQVVSGIYHRNLRRKEGRRNEKTT